VSRRPILLGLDDCVQLVSIRSGCISKLGMKTSAAEIMPGKAEVPVDFYLEAFAAAVAIFGRGQVSTYLLGGLGDSVEGMLEAAQRLIAIGVYPFVVPFVPISGTPLADREPPSAEFMPTGSAVFGVGLRPSKY
jgi:biotin synthase-related radical SAM superfamily protein